MVKTTRYCDICGRIIEFSFYQMQLPEMNNHGEIVLSSKEQDICKLCFRNLYWKMSEIKHPNRKCPD